VLLGNVQIEVLRKLRAAEQGIPVEELYPYWGKKEGGQLGVAGLERRGLINIKDGKAFFEKYPPGVDIDVVSMQQEDASPDIDDMTRNNLIYTYKDELKGVETGDKNSSLPNGVRRSLQKLGVLKWKILELTDLGRILLQQVSTQALT